MTEPPTPQPAASGSEPAGASVSSEPASGSSQAGPDDLWAPSEPQENPLRGTRASGTWIAIIIFALILVLLLIFVLQNTQRVEISYFSADFKLPLAVAMLLSAVAGVLLTAIAGTLRILQLRRRVRSSRRG